MVTNTLDWDMIIEQINDGGCTPVIGNHLVGQVVFGDVNIVEAWAQQAGFPLQERRNLTRVAQYLSFSSGSPLSAKRRYLNFLKERMLTQAKARPDANLDLLQQVESQLRSLTFSELVCEHLHQPNFRRDTDNPLSILAALDFKLYLTTSPHRLLEAALTAWGKDPQIEVYAWRDDIQDALEEKNLLFRDENKLVFPPTIEKPLVVHLHGIDDVPGSLVLSEDDYLEFLVNITRDLPTRVMRNEVRTAIRNSLLLLIGYRMHAWDLRVLLQGVIRKKSISSQLRSFAVQLEPHEMGGVLDPTNYQHYLTNYFNKIEFDVYWGNPQNFLQTLWRKVEEG